MFVNTNSFTSLNFDQGINKQTFKIKKPKKPPKIPFLDELHFSKLLESIHRDELKSN